MRYSALKIIGVLIITSLFLVGCNDDDPVAPDPDEEVSFSQHVLPLFQQYGCTGCHPGNAGLDVRTVDALLQGGVSGPAIEPGNADGSLLIQMISPNPPPGRPRMPEDGPPFLSESEQETIARWIDEGAEDN